MIESREASDVKEWLTEYPNIQIVSRDGSQSYATAIRESHPEAIQISDRFHLIKNLTDYAKLALQKIFQGRVAIPITEETQKHRTVMLMGTEIQRVGLVRELYQKGHNQEEISMITGISKEKVRKYRNMKDSEIQTEKQTVRGREHEEAVEKVRQRADVVRSLHSEGLNMTEITQMTGFGNTTIRNYLSDNFSPINAHYGKQREGKLEPFRNEVLKLRLSGLKYGEIHAVIKEKGYTGTEDAIRGFISKERRIHQDLLAVDIGTEELIDKKWLIRLLYKPIDDVKGISETQLKYVLATHPVYEGILGIVKEFKAVLKSKKPNMLLPWIDTAAALGVTEINSFIDGIKLDFKAVANAIFYNYNNGLAEGIIHKIKVIKRIMYGRCRFALLRNKCILLSHY